MTTAFAPAGSFVQPKPYQAIGQRAYRYDGIDFLRGLIMIIMALDHTRDFFHKYALSDDPLNLQTTTPVLFFTRWITHFCAPTFVFLAGTSIFFQSLRKSKKELALFLLKRGLWLILVELVIMDFSYSFDIHFRLFALQTIWSIAISMIILALVIWLPFRAILFIGLLIVLGHNSLDFLEKDPSFKPGWGYDLLHRPGFYHLWGTHYLFILYPFLSWAGLMMLGYCFGKLYVNQEARRKKWLLIIGFSAVALFIILRLLDKYGDPLHWSPQKNSTYTFLSFMNVLKYPPSLLYMLATIGPALIFLAFTDKLRNGFTRFVTVYGRVPFFYYILHFFLIHIFSAIAYLMRGHTFQEGSQPQKDLLIPQFIKPGEGYSLELVYLIWIGIVLLLYPLCKWFANYKQKHKDWWLSYL